jgi:hypothetical protein
LQNKFLVAAVGGLIAAVAVLSVAVVFLNSSIKQMNQNDKVAITYEGQMIKIQGATYATMAVNFQVDSGVLYNCRAKVSYVANNGSSVQITKELGALNINTNHMGTGFQLTDYPSEKPFLANFSSTNPLLNVQIEAFGYTKP